MKKDSNEEKRQLNERKGERTNQKKESANLNTRQFQHVEKKKQEWKNSVEQESTKGDG